MCGVFGIVSPRLAPSELDTRLAAMARALHHRGPDDRAWRIIEPPNRGESSTRRVGLGLTRLAILDLETGMQPIAAEDGSTIVANGQLYNYRELRAALPNEAWRTQGDIEVMLRTFLRRSFGAFQEFNGMYAGAILHHPRRQLFLFRDRFGVKPLYYAAVGEDLIFASEIRALFASGLVTPRLNTERLPDYFSFRFVPGEETMFAGVRRLAPGAYMAVDLATGRRRVECYWQPRFDAPKALSVEEASERYAELIHDSVALRMRADVPVGTLVSGGIDSSVVTALSARRNPAIHAFTVGFDETAYDERAQVRGLLASDPAVFGGVTVHEALCGPDRLARLPDLVQSVEEPIALAAMIATDTAFEAVRGAGLKVVLTGEGADELFAGYRRMVVDEAARAFAATPDTAEQERLLSLWPELRERVSWVGPGAPGSDDPALAYATAEALFSPEETQRLLALSSPPEFAVPPDARPFLTGRETALSAFQAFEWRGRLPDYVILRLDKLSMRHSVEAREPFLDYRLAEFALRLPDSLKIDLGSAITPPRDKRLCRMVAESRGWIPPANAAAPKTPFTAPWGPWLSQPALWPEILRDLFHGNLAHRQGILDPALVRDLGTRIGTTTHQATPATIRSDADRLLAVAVLSIWADQYLSPHAPAVTSLREGAFP